MHGIRSRRNGHASIGDYINPGWRSSYAISEGVPKDSRPLNRTHLQVKRGVGFVG